MTTHFEEDTPPRASLGTWPTPLEPAPRLARALGLGPDDLWVKRDDLTGLGGGGNKIRKLEWTCGAALTEGATTLVTTGAPQSNHARLTAAAGARLGLRVVLVLAGKPGSSASGNLALDGLFGATIVWAGDGEGLESRAQQVVEELRRRGEIPALIPFGGPARSAPAVTSSARANSSARHPTWRPSSSRWARAAPWPDSSPDSAAHAFWACTAAPSPTPPRPCRP
jgi:D-cysteine desulfhydrase